MLFQVSSLILERRMQLALNTLLMPSSGPRRVKYKPANAKNPGLGLLCPYPGLSCLPVLLQARLLFH